MITYQTNEYGLREKDMDFLLCIYTSFPAVKKVILYGSRATGTYERGSDVDLVIVGNDVSYEDISKMKVRIENENPSLLSYSLILMDSIKNEKLKSQIDKYGKVIYQKDNAR
jgi:predicted nucleotidyltransferase